MTHLEPEIQTLVEVVIVQVVEETANLRWIVG